MKNAKVIYKADPSCEHYTPLAIRELAHEVLGRIEIDPSTSERNPMQALRAITQAEGGLTTSWGNAQTVWLNPPYGLGIGAWLDSFFAHLRAVDGRGLALVPARCGARWYRKATEAANVVCELDGRLTFEDRNGQPLRFNGKPSPARWGCVLLYVGDDTARIARELRKHGATRIVHPRALVKSSTVDERQATIATLGGICARCLRPMARRCAHCEAVKIGKVKPIGSHPFRASLTAKAAKSSRDERAQMMRELGKKPGSRVQR